MQVGGPKYAVEFWGGKSQKAFHSSNYDCLVVWSAGWFHYIKIWGGTGPESVLNG